MCRRVDAEVMARHATVGQLRRALGRYVFAESEAGEEPVGDAPPRPDVDVRQVGFGHTEFGTCG